MKKKHCVDDGDCPKQKEYSCATNVCGVPRLHRMLENGDHTNFVFAFFRPHVASVFVLNTQSQPQIANPRIIITNQMAVNADMILSLLRALSV
jgi:hypothetical protein